MNILHISSATSWRGGEQQIAYLVDELKSLGHNNFLLHPINAPIADHTLICMRCHTISYSKGFSVNPLVSLKIKSIADKHKIDIIHAHDSHSHTFLYLSYRLFRLSCPSVVSRRVDFAISPSSYAKYNYSAIKKIICVSDKINEIISSTLGVSKRIATVHSGVDIEKFDKPSVINLKEKYNIPNHHKVVANVSAIADHKDYETFVKTANLILQDRKDIHFFIIGGDGGEQENITKLISDMNLSQNIHLTGYIENAYTLFNQFDIFFFPSKMEGLGTSLLDAQASGVPIVSTYAGGIPELVSHDKTGFLSNIGDIQDLANNILSILDNPDRAQRFIAAAKSNVSKYSKKLTAQKTLEIYQDVI